MDIVSRGAFRTVYVDGVNSREGGEDGDNWRGNSFTVSSREWGVGKRFGGRLEGEVDTVE